MLTSIPSGGAPQASLASQLELPATIPAGPARPNESIYVLDEELRLLPLGLPD